MPIILVIGSGWLKCAVVVVIDGAADRKGAAVATGGRGCARVLFVAMTGFRSAEGPNPCDAKIG